MNETAQNDSLPLKATAKEGKITISIGRITLANAAQLHPEFYDMNLDQPMFRVINHFELASDVLNELNRESEDGTSLITAMLDEAIKRAIENGSEGVLFLGGQE